MKYNPDIHHRQSIRLKDFDYSQANAYFITICTQNRECLFGEINDGKMILNNVGTLVEEEWVRTANVRHYITLDAFIIMPNHVHGIIVFNGRGTPVACPEVTQINTMLSKIQGTPPACPYESKFGKGIPHSLPTIIGQFKSLATKQINTKWNVSGVKIWQRNYYEHIIRDEESLGKIREYIVNNPINWQEDEMNQNRSAAIS